MEFKLHPHRSATPRSGLLAEHEQISPLACQVWLWLEGRRLGRPFARIRDYALAEVNKCPDTSAWRNRLIHARTFGLRGLFLPRASRYPRERLFNALALLLWEPAALRDPALCRQIQNELRTSARTFLNLVPAYERLWAKFR